VHYSRVRSESEKVFRMGRRKTRKKVVTKKKDTKLPKSFDCPYCHHEQTIECKIDRQNEVATLRCRVCDVNYVTQTTSLTQPIDVYSEWLDHCEAANQLEGPASNE
jgi:transcription elongation factor Elf1